MLNIEIIENKKINNNFILYFKKLNLKNKSIDKIGNVNLKEIKLLKYKYLISIN